MVMVRERTGILSCFVRRMEALEPARAERRARTREARDTSRLIAL